MLRSSKTSQGRLKCTSSDKIEENPDLVIARATIEGLERGLRDEAPGLAFDCVGCAVHAMIRGNLGVSSFHSKMRFYAA